MAGEKGRVLGERPLSSPSSLDLLEVDARARGWRVERTAQGGVVVPPGSSRRPLPWPPAAAVAKSSLPALLRGAPTLRTVSTTAYDANLDVAFPLCIKPDIGSLGSGFRRLTTAEEWRHFVDEGPRDTALVVQPLLRGPECRLTICANGMYACADLLERRGPRSRWRDATPHTRSEWLEDLYPVLTRLDVPVIGVDIMQQDGVPYLLDVNVAPDLAVHLATDTPRNLAGAVLDSWLTLS